MAGDGMAGDGYLAGHHTWQGTGTWHEQPKRLGEDRFFSEAFVVFHNISVIFRAICLVVLRFFVYLQTTKGYRYLQLPRVRRIICNQFFL